MFTEQSDALVGRVKTFVILHTKEFKIAFKIRNLQETFKFTNLKIRVCSFDFEAQITQQWCRQISSMMKFAQQNFHFPIVGRNLYER
jgi:hypothetical protein